ncbi:VOC family protein [Tamaricihabitans halophyticus]|nr:VOC family protein [Tamaricihabitans halophyticus]
MSIYPTLRYTDATAALAFLRGAFGMTEQHVSTTEDGTVGHAELSWGDGIVMVGTRTNPPDQFDTGRAVLYLPVDDVDAHHERALAAGAEIHAGLTDQPYGSREYAALDPEGNNIWCFGTYRPSLD